MAYLEWRRRQALAASEGYGSGHTNEPEPMAEGRLVSPWIAILPLVLVAILNKVFTIVVESAYGKTYDILMPGLEKPIGVTISGVAAIWAVEGALLLGILTVFVFAFRTVKEKFAEGSKSAIAGALLASMNTASEYGFGGVIATLPGFIIIRDALAAIPHPLVNEAVTVTTLAGITGSASGGMSIALAAMADQFMAAANAAGIPPEVLHRVASMASGGMDTLPHNGAVITLLAVCGLDAPPVLQGYLRDHLYQDTRGILRHCGFRSDRHPLSAPAMGSGCATISRMATRRSSARARRTQRRPRRQCQWR